MRPVKGATPYMQDAGPERCDVKARPPDSPWQVVQRGKESGGAAVTCRLLLPARRR
ncbi:hypothetical protein ACFQU2_36655 [Siccirubricoccus deserti]